MANYKIYKQTEISKDKNPNREKNQDRYLTVEYCFMNDEKIKLLILADGAGGHYDGEKAAYDAVHAFAESVYRSFLNKYCSETEGEFYIKYSAAELEEILKKGFYDANRAICENREDYRESLTTLSVVAIQGDYAMVANVGDSPVYYYNAELGELKLVSELHNLGALNGNPEEDHILYRCLGKYSKIQEEEVYTRLIGYLQEGDYFLLGSDGAFGSLTENKIAEILENTKGTRILKDLFAEARIGCHSDDQTAILYQVLN